MLLDRLYGMPAPMQTALADDKPVWEDVVMATWWNGVPGPAKTAVER